MSGILKFESLSYIFYYEGLCQGRWEKDNEHLYSIKGRSCWSLNYICKKVTIFSIIHFTPQFWHLLPIPSNIWHFHCHKIHLEKPTSSFKEFIFGLRVLVNSYLPLSILTHLLPSEILCEIHLNPIWQGYLQMRATWSLPCSSPLI